MLGIEFVSTFVVGYIHCKKINGMNNKKLALTFVFQ